MLPPSALHYSTTPMTMSDSSSPEVVLENHFPIIRDVARRGRVSLGAVMATLDGFGRLGETTRQASQTGATELGYRPNASCI
jgi:hypothetical protein